MGLVIAAGIGGPLSLTLCVKLLSEEGQFYRPKDMSIKLEQQN
jgi:hypothetical protein